MPAEPKRNPQKRKSVRRRLKRTVIFDSEEESYEDDWGCCDDEYDDEWEDPMDWEADIGTKDEVKKPPAPPTRKQPKRVKKIHAVQVFRNAANRGNSTRFDSPDYSHLPEDSFIHVSPWSHLQPANETLTPSLFRDKLALLSYPHCPSDIIKRAEHNVLSSGHVKWFDPSWKAIWETEEAIAAGTVAATAGVAEAAQLDLSIWGPRRYVVLESVTWQLREVRSMREAVEQTQCLSMEPQKDGIELGRGWILFVNDSAENMLQKQLNRMRWVLQDRMGSMRRGCLFEQAVRDNRVKQGGRAPFARLVAEKVVYMKKYSI